MVRKTATVLALVAISCAPAAVQADQASAVAAARSLPGVIDAVADTTGNLYVSVKPNNDSLKMKQFAAFVCRIIIPHEGRIFRVRVVDITAVPPSKPPGSWPRIAEVKCDGSR